MVLEKRSTSGQIPAQNNSAGIFFFFLFSVFLAPSFAQSVLPLYEMNEAGEVLLERVNAIPENVKKKYDTISILHEKGICYGKTVKFRLSAEKECCTHPDPKFLLGSVKLKEKECKGILLLGKAEQGKILNYDSLKAKTNLFEMISEEFQPPVVNKEVITRYRWAATEVNGKKDVFLQSVSKNNSKNKTITYNVALKRCLHIRTDSTDFYYCFTDTSGNYKKQDVNWYDDRIKWSLLYVNQKLIYAIPDFSGSSLDGHGPFHYKEQKLSAIYTAKGVTYYYFSPGYVIYYKDKEWKLANREPLRYYGECDCE